MDRILQSASLIGLAGLAGVSGRLATSALAQETWKPERPIQVFIQFAAGGGTDTVTRTLLEAMEPFSARGSTQPT